MKYIENQIQARELARRQYYVGYQNISTTHYAIDARCNYRPRQEVVDWINRRMLRGELTPQQAAYEARSVGELTRRCRVQLAESIKRLDNELWSLRARHARLRRMLETRPAPAARPDRVYVAALRREVPAGPTIKYTVSCGMPNHTWTKQTSNPGEIGALIAGVPKTCYRPIKFAVNYTRNWHRLATYEIR